MAIEVKWARRVLAFVWKRLSAVELDINRAKRCSTENGLTLPIFLWANLNDWIAPFLVEHFKIIMNPQAPACDIPLYKSVRFVVAFLSLLGTAIMYITRVNLNIAILAMVKQDNLVTMFNQSTGSPYQTTVTTGEFEWTPPEQGLVLGSFFYGKSLFGWMDCVYSCLQLSGYIVTQIIGGRLAESYSSPNKIIFLALGSSGLINILTPWLARISVTVFVLSRIVLGACQGVVYPAFYCLFANWIPSNERSTFIPWLDAGITMGTVLISASSGQLIVLFSEFGGWPAVFYFSG